MVTYRRLLLCLLLATLSATALAADELHYRLSYSGLITGYVWKELADVTLNLTPEVTQFRGQPAARLSMQVTTADYSVAETIHSLRYQWESILGPDLQRTLLVRVIDRGDSDSEEVYWYNWENRAISLYRKREQRDVSIPMFDEAPKLEWETDHLPAAPEFIDTHPALSPGMGYLIQETYLPAALGEDAVDPLAMLMRLRHHNYQAADTLSLQILNADDLAPYQARFIGREGLQLGNCSVPAIKLEVRRSNSSGEDGVMTMWLSDDERRQPLRIDVDASLGMLHIERQRGHTTATAGVCADNSK
jgi:hypothetical protein